MNGMKMKMINLKLPRVSKKDMQKKLTVGMPGDSDNYPYGLRLSLSEDQIKKLGNLYDMDVEGEVMICAKARVSDKRSHERQGKSPERSLELQITDMSCKPMEKDDEGEDGDPAWYNNMKGKK